MANLTKPLEPISKLKEQLLPHHRCDMACRPQLNTSPSSVFNERNRGRRFLMKNSSFGFLHPSFLHPSPSSSWQNEVIAFDWWAVLDAYHLTVSVSRNKTGGLERLRKNNILSCRFLSTIIYNNSFSKITCELTVLFVLQFTHYSSNISAFYGVLFIIDISLKFGALFRPTRHIYAFSAHPAEIWHFINFRH